MKTINIEDVEEFLDYAERLESELVGLVQEYDECTELDLPAPMAERLARAKSFLETRGLVK